MDDVARILASVAHIVRMRPKPASLHGAKCETCRWCGAQITRTQRWRDKHPGCTHVKRRLVRLGPKSPLGDPALLAAAERELEAWWLAEGWGERPPSIVLK